MRRKTERRVARVRAERGISAETRERAVSTAQRHGASLMSIARFVGVAPDELRGWVAHRAAVREPDPRACQQLTEVESLRSEVARLRIERAILRTATRRFMQEQTLRARLEGATLAGEHGVMH